MDQSTIGSGSSCDGETKKSRPRTISDSMRIRRNLFLKLGVHPGKSDALFCEPARGSLLGQVSISIVPLHHPNKEQGKKEHEAVSSNASSLWGFGSLFEKGLRDSERTISSSFSSSESSSPVSAGKKTRKLTFNTEVLVCPIPQRVDYSKRIRDCLWTSPEEAARNAERNAIEFASEGWDWRLALDDEDMYQHASTSELIHPIHVELWRAQTGTDFPNLYLPGGNPQYAPI